MLGLCRGERGPCCFSKRSKSSRIVHRNVRENLAIDFDSGTLQSVHEYAVAHVVLMCGGIDAHDPQLSEIALLVLAIAVRVFPAALDIFFCCFPKFAASAECAASGLHN